MSVLSRVQSVLPKIGYAVLPTVVDVAVAYVANGALQPITHKKINWKNFYWILGGSTLAGFVSTLFVRRKPEFSGVLACLSYLTWKVYEGSICYSAWTWEKAEIMRKQSEEQGRIKQAAEDKALQEKRKIAGFFTDIQNPANVKEYFEKTPEFFKKTNYEGKNPLHLFAEQGQADLIRWMQLVGLSSELNVATSKGWKPLHLAIKNGQLECAKVLFQHDPKDLDEEIPEVGNAQMIAFDEGRVAIVKWLEEEQKLLKDNQTHQQLFEQILQTGVQNVLALEWLYTDKIPEEQKASALQTALTLAVEKGHLAIAKWVVGKDKTALQKLDADGNNLMYTAIAKGQAHIAGWLDVQDPSLFDQAKAAKNCSKLKVDSQGHPQMVSWLTTRMLSKKT